MPAPAEIAEGPQHMAALQRANEVRLARATLKRRVAEGEVSVAAVVLTIPVEAEGMAVADLLMCQRRWGRARCRKLLSAVPLSETKPLGSLTERQRRALASLVEASAGAPAARRRDLAALAV